LLPGVPIGIVYATKNRYEFDNPIVVGLSKSFLGRKFSTKLRRSFGLTIYDEVHLFAASQHYALTNFGFGFRLGLTGTPKNKGYEKLYYNSIGPIVYTDDTPDSMLELYSIHTDLRPAKPINGGFASYMSWLEESEERTQIIADLANMATRNGRKTIILSDRVSLSKKLAEKIYNSFLVIGEIDLDIRYSISENKNIDVVVATSPIAKHGVDVPWWDTLILATPFSEKILQAVGRIIRAYKGKWTPKMIYIQDVYKSSASIFTKNVLQLNRYTQSKAVRLHFKDVKNNERLLWGP
jgi:superfamily II DNA or RNA helicase